MTLIPGQLQVAFAEAVVPVNSPVHVKRAGWPSRPGFVNDFWVDLHLARRSVVGARWSVDRHFDFAVIDLDNKKHNMATLAERYLRTFRALRGLPHVVVRSSSSWGFHVYVFFQQSHPGSEIRTVLENALCQQGLMLESGQCEIWPSNQVLRLPLGSGSFILNVFCTGSAVAWHPMFHKRSVTKAKQRYPSVQVDRLASLEELLRRSQDRIALDDLRVAPRKRRRPPRKPTAEEKCVFANPSGARNTVVMASDQGRTVTLGFAKGKTKTQYLLEIESIKVGAQEGQRVEQWKKLIWHLVHREKMSVENCVAFIMGWLKTGKHTSVDLTGPQREMVTQTMINGTRTIASHYWDELEAKGISPRSTATPLSIFISSVPPGADWRGIARGSLLLADWRWIEASLSGNVWSSEEPRLQVLLGLFRALGTRDGEVLPISSRDLHRIAGGKYSTLSLPTAGHTRVISRPAVTTLRYCASAVGLLTKVTDSSVGHATTYRINLDHCDNERIPGRGSKNKGFLSEAPAHQREFRVSALLQTTSSDREN